MNRKFKPILLVVLLVSVLIPHALASDEFTQEIAQRAVIVAMTNCQSIDVFMDDGNHYDPSKFHSYADETECKMGVYEEGIWTAIGENTWHVENLKLVMIVYDTYLRITCDVTFDGADYILSNGTKIIASLKYLNSDDPSWQDIENIEPNEYHPYLTVSPNLIKDDRNTDGLTP
ncbi:MAG: hypothetical protein GX418_12335 [Clostridiales bacterium]|nr:hypothetical protein [Clostridiales bacterium]